MSLSTYFLLFLCFLTDRTLIVNLLNFFPSPAGVPQGSILGPIRYTVYTADIPTYPSTVLTPYLVEL